MNICVFCSSSDHLEDAFLQEAESLASLICLYQHNLVFGGACVGLMGRVASGVKNGQRVVTGVIPELIHSKGICFQEADEVIITTNMRERKATMHSLADAFIAMPGGFGTLEELLEIITLRQLQLHNKPVVLINTNGYYDLLLEFFDRLFHEKFAHSAHRNLFFVAADAKQAMEFINQYQPLEVANKWA